MGTRRVPRRQRERGRLQHRERAQASVSGVREQRQRTAASVSADSSTRRAERRHREWAVRTPRAARRQRERGAQRSATGPQDWVAGGLTRTNEVGVTITPADSLGRPRYQPRYGDHEPVHERRGSPRRACCVRPVVHRMGSAHMVGGEGWSTTRKEASDGHRISRRQFLELGAANRAFVLTSRPGRDAIWPGQSRHPEADRIVVTSSPIISLMPPAPMSRLPPPPARNRCWMGHARRARVSVPRRDHRGRPTARLSLISARRRQGAAECGLAGVGFGKVEAWPSATTTGTTKRPSWRC